MLLETQSALLHTTKMRLLGLLSFKKGKKHHECVIKVYMIFKYTTFSSTLHYYCDTKEVCNVTKDLFFTYIVFFLNFLFIKK